MHLTAGKGESLAESHNEVLDVVDNLLLDDALINILVSLPAALH